MKKIIIVCFSLFSLTAIASSGNIDNLGLIPLPSKVTPKTGYFNISNNTGITYQSDDCKQIVSFLKKILSSQFDVNLNTGKTNNKIELIIDAMFVEDEYTLDIDNRKITIRGSRSGVFYGVQTLLQLINSSGTTKEIQVQQIEIQDKPRFAYRGVMLDVGRYFYSPEYIKRLLDLMAYYKLNKFHWHLTEDAGWRVEIKRYPLLTKVGAWRSRTQKTRNPDSFDNLPHGGFYTQEQIKDVVEYAQERNIEIIPEIDLPGHTVAAIASYPHLSCTGEPMKVSDFWKIREEIVCAGSEDTYTFIENVLDEVIELFPSATIHVGGDEAPKVRWKKCPTCQNKIKSEGLKDEHELQLYFSKRLAAYLTNKGKKILGWDGYIVNGEVENAMVMAWQGVAGGIEAAKKGHEVIMSPHQLMYFDYYQGSPKNEPFNIGGDLPLKKVYDYEPVSKELSPEHRKNIIGVQGNIWAEFIHSESKVEYMGFPRILALSEIGWSGTQKNYENFYSRMSINLVWLDKNRINFRIPEPLGFQDTVTESPELKVTLTKPIRGSSILYTFDEEGDPLVNGVEYKQPFILTLNTQDSITIRSVIKAPSGRISRTYSATYKLKKD